MDSECKITIDAGACRMITVITAKDNFDGTATVEFDSNCPYVNDAVESINVVNPVEIIAAGIEGNKIYNDCSMCAGHAACAVPCGMIKAMEIIAGLALKKDVTIKIE